MTADIAKALRMLGAAYRGDWSDFDGRTLRHQLEELARFIEHPDDFELKCWAEVEGICMTCYGWSWPNAAWPNGKCKCWT